MHQVDFSLNEYIDMHGQQNIISLLLFSSPSRFSKMCPFPVFIPVVIYEGRTESHEQLFFACELGTADEGEYSGRWNQLLCYP